MKEIKRNIRECSFLTCSVKIFPSDVYACLRETEKRKGRGIEISAMELSRIKLCN